MLDDAAWEAANATFLGTALAWLRDRLQHFARPQHDAAFAGHLPFESGMDPPPALLALGQCFGLSAFELDVMLLCIAMELDTRTSGLCALAHDNPQRAYPTFALALSVFADAAWDALSPQRPLRYWRLIEVPARGADPLTSVPLRADERIVNFVKGLNELDERCADLVTAIEATADDGDLPPTQQRVAEAIFRTWKDELRQAPAVARLVGSDAASSLRVATEVSTALGRRIYYLNVDALPQAGSELDGLARLWRRESALLPVTLYIDAHALEGGDIGALPALRRFIARAGGFTFVAMPESGAALKTRTFAFDVAKPTPDEQRQLWETQLGDQRRAVATRLVSQFNLDAATIAIIGRRETQGSNAEDIEQRVWDACRASLRPQLDELAQRLEAKATWDDLVLPAAQLGLLHQIAAQVPARHAVYESWGYGAKMNRGFGVTALFAGESGTGKTMSAEVIANALSLSLYRIDLSAVINKYIGETEKNLRKLFDAADDGGVILFFDEADALFGKRSDVRDSHDRYANIETNYLLQRMEAFRGLAILATNMRSSLDSAFTRRLRFIVNFPHPGHAERKRMWERAFPAQALGEALDFGRLAKWNLTGASIAGIALNAAFLAVRDGSRISLAHVLIAVRQEFIKADRPINEADFGEFITRGAA